MFSEHNHRPRQVLRTRGNTANDRRSLSRTPAEIGLLVVAQKILRLYNLWKSIQNKER